MGTRRRRSGITEDGLARRRYRIPRVSLRRDGALGTEGPLVGILLGGATLACSGLPASEMGSPEPAASRDSLEALYWMPGPTSGDGGEGLAIDDEGNLFVAGSHGGLDVDGDGTVDVVADGIDPFFLKFSAEGTLAWIRTGSEAGFQSTRRIAPDRSGGLYAVGSFRETMDFGDGVGVYADGNPSSYLIRYDAEGRVAWTRTFAGDALSSFRDVDSDREGNVYVAGLARGRFRLEGVEADVVPRRETVQVVASYDPAGTLRWIRVNHGGPTTAFVYVRVGPGGDLFVSGSFGQEGIDFDDDGAPEIEGRRGRHGFFARLDATRGEFLDARRVIGPESDGDGHLGVSVGEVNIMSDGDLAVGVGTTDWADLDGDGSADVRSPGGERPAGFLVRYSPDGEIRWWRRNTIDTVWDVATDGERFLLAGAYEGERDLNDDGVIDERDGVGYAVDGEREAELVVLLLSGDGRVERAILAPGLGNDSARGAAFLPGGRSFYVTGSIQLSADFSRDGTDDEGYLRCDALGDLFVARYTLIGTECEMSLSATGRRGERLRLADLTWAGAPTNSVDIYRNGERVATTANDGAYTDEIPQGVRGPYDYHIVPTGMAACATNTVRVGF